MPRGSNAFNVFLPSALPSFQQHLVISPGNDLVDRMKEANSFGPVYGDFEFRVSTLVVGVGSLLRDELAQLRYLGPLRDLHPRDDGELGRPHARRWANGSAAWISSPTMPTTTPRFFATRATGCPARNVSIRATNCGRRLSWSFLETNRWWPRFWS